MSSWYKTNGTNPGSPTNPLTDLLSLLANGVSNPAVAGHGGITIANLQSSGVLTPGMTDFLNNQTTSTGKPKAYLNWIVLDEQFKLVSESSSFEEVGDNEELKIHTKTDLTIAKSGYLYVYVSNVTGNIPVYFDNLQVTHTRGPLLEEDHYYPFGLQMKGICSKGAGGVENKFKFNGGVELDGDFGVDIYETFFRGYDAQIGRFRSVDPKAEITSELSTFQFSGNNPVMYNDPLGDFFGWMDGNGNKWHGRDPLAGTGGAGHTFLDGYDLGGYGGGGGGSSATVDANGNYHFSADAAQNVFIGFMNSYNNPKDDGSWSFTVGFSSKGNLGYWTSYAYSVNNGDKEGSGKGFTSTGSNLNELVMGRTFVILGINESKKDLDKGSFDDDANVVNTYGLVQGSAEALVTYDVAGRLGKSMARVSAGDLAIIGKGATIMKYLKGVGIAGSAATTIYSGYKAYNQYENGGFNEVAKHRDIWDAGMGGIGVAAIFIGATPLGWGLGAGVLIYGGITLFYDYATEK